MKTAILDTPQDDDPLAALRGASGRSTRASTGSSCAPGSDRVDGRGPRRNVTRWHWVPLEVQQQLPVTVEHAHVNTSSDSTGRSTCLPNSGRAGLQATGSYGTHLACGNEGGRRATCWGIEPNNLDTLPARPGDGRRGPHLRDRRDARRDVRAKHRVRQRPTSAGDTATPAGLRSGSTGLGPTTQQRQRQDRVRRTSPRSPPSQGEGHHRHHHRFRRGRDRWAHVHEPQLPDGTSTHRTSARIRCATYLAPGSVARPGDGRTQRRRGAAPTPTPDRRREQRRRLLLLRGVRAASCRASSRRPSRRCPRASGW